MPITPGGNQNPPGKAHPPGCYYVNVATATIQRQCNPLLATALAAAGFVGNDGFPANPTNAFPTFAAAKAYAGSAGTLPGAGAGIANSLTGPFTAIGNFFGMLTSRQTLIRVAEGMLGMLLILIGGYVFIQGEVLNSQTFKNLMKAAK